MFTEKAGRISNSEKCGLRRDNFMRNKRFSDEAAVAAHQNVKEKEYWLERLSGDFVKSNFPYDFNEENGNRGAVETVTVECGGEPFEKLMKLSGGVDVKLHMILVAALNALLYKYTGTRDIVIGSPILKQDIEGEFINTVLLYRDSLREEAGFKELILQARETIIKAAEHQNYPLEYLPRTVNIAAPEGEFPLFDIVLLYRSLHDQSYIDGIPYHMLFSFDRSDSRLGLALEYDSRLYRRETAQQVAGHYIHLLGAVLADVNAPLKNIDILSEGERQRLLKEFNTNRMDIPGDKTFHELFEEQVEKTRERTAVTALGVGLSYGQLNERANRLARLLREKGVGPNTIVPVSVERSVEMIFAVMGVIKAGGAYLPVDPTYPKERIKYMLDESQAKVLVAQRHLKETVPFDGEIIEVENIAPGAADTGNPEHVNSPTDMVYVIYTSGSTGKPKGVIVQHNHFVNAGLGWRDEYKLREMEVNLLQMASFSFDVFAGDLARVLINGGKLVVNPEQAAAPESLYQLIKNHGVTLFESTPSYIMPFMDYVYENNLPLDSLKLLILGSDSCPVRDFKKLLSRFGKKMRIINSYGVTEATIDSSYYEEYRMENIPASGNVPIGRPLPNVSFYVAGPGGDLLPPGVPGELYVGGAGVTRGYLNNPELTEKKFNRAYRTHGTYRNNGTARIDRTDAVYKTGDLARWLSDGNMQFLGRMDYQVKVRGYRIELGEIESKLLEHPEVKEAVVTEIEETADDKYLCGYVVSETELEAEHLRDFLGKKLPDYMIPWFFVRMDRFPLTPNGKIDRKALPIPGTSGEAAYVAPRTDVEKTLVRLWSDVLKVETERIGIDTNFFDLGGNSLKAIVLITWMHKELDIKLQMTDVFKLQTVRNIAQLTESAGKEEFIPIEPVEKKEYYRLSPAQKRLFILEQMSSVGTAYNIPQAVELPGTVEKEKIESIFRNLIKRHESLRTSFEMIDGEPAQRVHDEVEFKVEYGEGASMTNNFVRRFNLSKAPLLRVSLVKENNGRLLLLSDIHHIVSDGISSDILVRDFLALYKGEMIPPLNLQYKDYSEWQNSEKQKEAVKKQEAYWLKQFEGKLPVLDLPSDQRGEGVGYSEGGLVRIEIGESKTKALRQTFLADGTTMFMLLLAVYYVLLLKLSGQERIVVGTPTVGRRHSDLEQVMGMFVNTLALVNEPRKEKPFLQFLGEVKERVLEAFENQDYPFDDLVDKVVGKRVPGRHPLFDVMFSFQAFELTPGPATDEGLGLKIPEIERDPEEKDGAAAKFDLLLHGMDGGRILAFEIEYSTRMFRSETVRRYAGYLDQVLSCILEDKEVKLKDIEVSHDLYEKQLENPQIDFGF
jgi:amino acid adenylation domain-containing protein